MDQSAASPPHPAGPHFPRGGRFYLISHGIQASSPFQVYVKEKVPTGLFKRARPRNSRLSFETRKSSLENAEGRLFGDGQGPESFAAGAIHECESLLPFWAVCWPECSFFLPRVPALTKLQQTWEDSWILKPNGQCRQHRSDQGWAFCESPERIHRRTFQHLICATRRTWMSPNWSHPR